jgi:hypothetical protein
MSRTFIRQVNQIRKSDTFTDNVTPSQAHFETNTTTLEDDLNSLRSQVHNLLKVQTGHWYDDINTPTQYSTGSKRGVNDLNTDLHAVEVKRVLIASDKYTTPIAVASGSNFVILGAAELPNNATAALGQVSTLGTVVATAGTFGQNDLAIVSGSSAINPKNMCSIVDATSHALILSDRRTIYALLQTESGVADGDTITDTTTTRAQLSFVRLTSAGDALEAVPSADIGEKSIHYAAVERVSLTDLNEQSFLRGAVSDIGGGGTVTREGVYINQGTTPAYVTTDSYLSLNASGISWNIADYDNAALFLSVKQDTALTESWVKVGDGANLFESNATLNHFKNGVAISTVGSTEIDMGINPGTIETIDTKDLFLKSSKELFLNDYHRPASSWSGPSGIKLSDSATEWNTFRNLFGEVSILNAINSSKNTDVRSKTFSTVTTDISANSDVYDAAGLDTSLPNMSAGSFLTDYDVYLNGELLRPGADSSVNNDYYPGSALAPQAKLKFEFDLKVGDVICIVAHAEPSAY